MIPLDDLRAAGETRASLRVSHTGATRRSRLTANESNPNAAWSAAQASVVRHADAREVEARVCATPQEVTPRALQVQEGDTVVLHVTNADRHPGEYRGFGLVAYHVNTVLAPGETKDVRFVASQPGVYDFYCSDFAPAFCADVLGRLEVVPRGVTLSDYDNNDGTMHARPADAGLPSPGDTDAPALSC